MNERERINAWQRAKEAVGCALVPIMFGYVLVLGFVFFLLWFLTSIPPLSPQSIKEFDWYKLTGFEGKTLWDWMELLIIPYFLLYVVYRFTRPERKSELKIAKDRQQETTLQNYLDKMTDLLLDERLRKNKESQQVARARTLTVLRQLDGERKRLVVQFLDEANLIKGKYPTVDLCTADLDKANLYLAKLSKDNLIGVNFVRADLYHANLADADLTGADLTGADLTRANLKGAKVTAEQLAQAKSLKGANMPDGTTHE